MSHIISFKLALFALIVILSTGSDAADVRITFPKSSKPTPVQGLNREGVKAVEKHDYTKAERLFYRAYLLDPSDPFTLNNLGYMSELKGDLDRAARFYELAAGEETEATIAGASIDGLRGQMIDKVAGHAEGKGMQVNSMNIRALGLLEKDRAPEADLLLHNALQLYPQNPFTLNNLGYAREREGELESALTYYRASADTHSQDPILVSAKREWRGKAISEVAAVNAKKLHKLLATAESPQARVERLNLRGVSAINRNDIAAARNYFQEAYRILPNNAFVLNNMGYVAELDGDRESADLFYTKAKEAPNAGAKVTVASRKQAEGLALGEVADKNDNQVSSAIAASAEARRHMHNPIVLKKR